MHYSQYWKSATVKVPAKKLSAYKKLLKKKGIAGKKQQIKKITLLPIVTLVIFLLFLNALLAILVTLYFLLPYVISFGILIVLLVLIGFTYDTVGT